MNLTTIGLFIVLPVVLILGGVFSKTFFEEFYKFPINKDEASLSHTGNGDSNTKP